MRQTIQKEVTLCDVCGEEGYAEPCLKCGKEVCWKCKKTQGVTYNAGVYFSGSGDGFYCHSCNETLILSRADELHNAYTHIRALRNEAEAFGRDFKNRQERAEEAIRPLLRT